ncbi:YraN family protein [Flagellimonas marinaquae]|uniref:YraN family protein n=1 Tax=Flagellimonas marinaquae TaxID=254955 RepID=UPI000F8ECD6A|nr:YraN family protein [Allomuricauda aquimarina]
MGDHNTFGKLGEQKAVDYLKASGYDIVKRNYRYLKAEIDIIARQGDILVIIEVKSRTKGFLEDVSHVITPKKVKLLTMAANHFVEEMEADVEVRFDIVTVIKHADHFDIEHIENAFYHF